MTGNAEFWEVFLEVRLRRRSRRAIEDPVIRQKIAQIFIESELFRLTTYRSLTRILYGKSPGP